MKDLISIIVPIYNVEKYLERCINSLVKQTYQNIEILLVDDGSTDSSGQICDSYFTIDKRITVYHKKNGGLSDARNYGLDRCSGTLITFVDSDDFVAPNYIELLFKALQDNLADVSICDSQYVYNENIIEDNVIERGSTVLTSYEAIMLSLNIRLRQSAWGKMYKRELFDNLRFPVGKLYEDLAIVYDVLLLSKKVVFIDAPAYYYLVRQGSIMQSEFNIKQIDEINIIDEAMDKVSAKYSDLLTLTNARRVYSYFLVLKRILLSPDPDKYRQLRIEIKKKIKKASKGMIWDNRVKFSMKIRIISYFFGEQAYLTCQKIADLRNQEVL